MRVYIYLTTGLFGRKNRAWDAAIVSYRLHGKDFNLDSTIAGLPAASFVVDSESRKLVEWELDRLKLPYEIETA